MSRIDPDDVGVVVLWASWALALIAWGIRTAWALLRKRLGR